MSHKVYSCHFHLSICPCRSVFLEQLKNFIWKLDNNIDLFFNLFFLEDFFRLSKWARERLYLTFLFSNNNLNVFENLYKFKSFYMNENNILLYLEDFRSVGISDTKMDIFLSGAICYNILKLCVKLIVLEIKIMMKEKYVGIYF